MIYSASKFRGSVNWLNRLRVAKGFPVDPDLSIEEFLTSRRFSSEKTEGFRSEQDDVSTKQARVDMVQDGYGGADDRRGGRVTETSSCQTLGFDIPNALLCCPATSCNNGAAEADSGHSHSSVTEATRGKQSRLSSGAGNNTAEKNLSSSPYQAEDEALRKPGNCTDSPYTDSPCQDATSAVEISQLYFNMFADLFCMDTCSLSSLESAGAMKKHHRKQEKPKICSTFADPEPPCAILTSLQLQTVEFDTNLRHKLDSGNPTSQSEVAAEEKMDIQSSSPEIEVTESTLFQQKKTLKKKSADSSKRKDDTESEISSRNEIFVIDTSMQGWRVEKVIIRRGNSWKIKDKGNTVPGKSNPESMVKLSKKRARTPHVSNTKREQTHSDKVQRQWELGTCTEKDNKDTGKSLMVTGAWGTAPQTHVRSRRKRRKNVLIEDEALKGIPEATIAKDEPSEKACNFASDHPANQPKEGLVYSVYQVFMQAGKAGLTAREAVSRILDQGLPGLHEGGVVPRVEVLKIVSNSPYFMPLEESKYILCSALVGDEDHSVGRKQNVQGGKQKDDENGNKCLDNVKSAKQHGISQYWAACAAIRRARTGKTRRKPSLGSYFLNPAINQETGEGIGGLPHKKRLKSMKQDVTGLGNPCNRSDGKGWHCPLRAKVGYLLCDHHLDRLRARVKSHIKSKMFSMTRASKEERKRILGGSWMVKKVVERSRIGRHSHVSIGMDAQDKVSTHPSEGSGSKNFVRSDRA